MERGRPTKDESEKIQILQIPIKKQDKDDLMDYIKGMGYEGHEKEFLTATLVSCSSTIQQLDFEDRIKEIDAQIQIKKARYERERARLTEQMDALDHDYQEDIKALESKKASTLAKIVSIKRYIDGPTDGELSRATDQLRPIVNNDRQRIEATMYDIKITRQSSEQAEKEYTKSNGFWDRITELKRKGNALTGKYIPPTAQDDLIEQFGKVIESAKGINWAKINPTEIEDAKKILNMNPINKYGQAQEIARIIDDTIVKVMRL